jgi:glutaredoxin
MTELIMVKTPSCPACKRMKQIIDESGVEVKVIDAYESVGNADFAAMHEVKAVPTLLKMSGNEVIDRHIGAMTVSQLKEFAVA